ncbi:MAG: D-glycero-beta-D-manno-heptose 1-phosphate adenylyltransferase [Gemmatimonadaceae bacterium]|nr:D-glycero-beta-D-manno-heptose 1-phosphate adenylyltransferase [Gemmatimonadaceae bacterium]
MPSVRRRRAANRPSSDSSVTSSKERSRSGSAARWRQQARVPRHPAHRRCGGLLRRQCRGGLRPLLPVPRRHGAGSALRPAELRRRHSQAPASARRLVGPSGGCQSGACASQRQPHHHLRRVSRDRRVPDVRANPPLRAIGERRPVTHTLFDPARKLFTRDALVAWRAAQPGRIAFTNGVFDLLHPGHLDVLRHARACGDALVVGLNADASVRRLKGPDRPVRSEAERAIVLAALEMVDAVSLFDEDTPRELILALQPDVIVKGGDYTPDTVVGAAEVRARGGEVVIVPLTPGHSTTSTIARLRDPGQSKTA